MGPLNETAKPGLMMTNSDGCISTHSARHRKRVPRHRQGMASITVRYGLGPRSNPDNRTRWGECCGRQDCSNRLCKPAFGHKSTREKGKCERLLRVSRDTGRLKSTENGRNQFRNGRMNWYCPLKVRVRRFRVHGVENPMDRFVPLRSRGSPHQESASCRRRQRSS